MLFYNNFECLFYLVFDVHRQFTVETCDLHVYGLIGNYVTSLLLFLKGHVDKPVNFDGVLKQLGKVALIIVT